MHFPCEIGTLEGYCGLETTACVARKINIIYISCSFLCIVLSWRAVGTVEGKWQRPCQACDVMNDFSHPRAWHEERPQRVTLLFSDVKKADHLLTAFISSTGRAPPCRIHTGKHSSSMKNFSARTQASCPGKLIFCILGISLLMNILLMNILWYDHKLPLSHTERHIPRFLQVFWAWRNWVLSLFPFPFLLFAITCTLTDSQLSLFPHTFPRSNLHTPLVDNQHENPFKSKVGRSCLQMGHSRMRRGKQHLLLDACLCMNGSLLDGFPCTEVFSLPTFDYLTALLKITLERWKEGNSEVPYSVCFSPAGTLSVQPHCSQALEGDMG